MSGFISQQSAVSSFVTADSWVILSPIEQRIKAKIERVGKPLKDWDIVINYGIKTGYNEAFIITGEKRKELIASDPNSAEIIRPILRGRDIQRYSYEYADLWIITTFPSLKIDINRYPSVKQHLMSFGYDRLKQTGELGARKKTNNEWFETQDSISYWDDFSKQKIVWKRVGSILRFCYDNSKYFALDSTCFATGEAVKYITAVLNSKLGNYLFKDSPKTGTGDLLISVQAVEPIRIPQISAADKNVIDELIDRLLAKEDNQVEVEKEIDFIVYQLYKLDAEETQFIEEFHN